MAFTYTDRNKKVILHSWGRFRVTLLEAVEVGDLLSRYNTDNAYTMQFADQSDSQAAEAIACEPGAAHAEIWACLAAELKAPVSIATGGVATQSYFAAAADFFGAPLYLGEDGKPASSAGGTMAQEVGCLLARDRIFLSCGGGLLAGAAAFTTLTASGAVALSSTFSRVGSVAIADPGDAGAIPVTVSGYCLLVTGGAETRTLAIPTAYGQVIDLFFKTDGGNCVVTVATPVNQAANTVLTFADAGDHIRLVAGDDGAGAKEWRVVCNDGVALA